MGTTFQNFSSGSLTTTGLLYNNGGSLINEGMLKVNATGFQYDVGTGSSMVNKGCMDINGYTNLYGAATNDGTIQSQGTSTVNKGLVNSGTTGRVIVVTGPSTIHATGSYSGRFCDRDTPGNNFDSGTANYSNQNIDCSPNTCNTLCPMGVTATPGSCSPTTGQYSITGHFTTGTAYVGGQDR